MVGGAIGATLGSWLGYQFEGDIGQIHADMRRFALIFGGLGVGAGGVVGLAVANH
jgi:hypothetical protein